MLLAYLVNYDLWRESQHVATFPSVSQVTFPEEEIIDESYSYEQWEREFSKLKREAQREFGSKD